MTGTVGMIFDSSFYIKVGCVTWTASKRDIEDGSDLLQEGVQASFEPLNSSLKTAYQVTLSSPDEDSD